MTEPTLIEIEPPPGLTDFTITITNEPSAQPEPQADSSATPQAQAE